MPPPSRGDAVASRRLLRALLREATYLPDPAARQFVRRHVLSAFDDYRIKPTKPDSELDSLNFSPERIREKFRQARKGLSLLRRANEGELRPLERILSWTYGRHGPYRYELLRKHLLVPDDLYGQQAVEHHYATLQKGDDRVVLDNLPRAVVEIPRKKPLEAEEPRVFEISPRYPRLKGFLEATVRNSHLIVSRSAKLKKTKFSVPARNTWERPMPHKRVRNQVEEWYATVLDKLQPPLAEEDWNRLRGLVLGQIPWEGLRPRRPRALEMQAHWSQYDVDKLVQYGHQLEIERLPTKMPGVDRAIRITPRSMRRLWAKIFAQCPVMWYDAQRKKWNAKWGFSTTWESDQAFKATADDLSLFEGAESFAADKKKRTSKRRSEDVEVGGKSPADG
ncbi:uncharacterized protein J3D65DRAFT_550507 [Phyllosticta citribraziliensis]|uniref:LYR motif-containing protein Cup1-like N-terminal domain-containing protein n=1 Tax=Phyllosticta citribraziliensis TaxID=989973 RepID=A0ABR1LXN8_9PEZI